MLARKFCITVINHCEWQNTKIVHFIVFICINSYRLSSTVLNLDNKSILMQMNGSICPGWEVFLKARLVATSYIRKCQNGRAFESHIKSSILEISASLVFEVKCGIELFSAFLDSMSSSYVLDNFYFLGLSTERVFWQIKKLKFGSTFRTTVN